MDTRLTADEVTALLVELSAGVPSGLTGPAADAMRATLKTELAELNKAGGYVHVPGEWPHPGDQPHVVGPPGTPVR